MYFLRFSILTFNHKPSLIGSVNLAKKVVFAYLAIFIMASRIFVETLVKTSIIA